MLVKKEENLWKLVMKHQEPFSQIAIDVFGNDEIECAQATVYTYLATVFTALGPVVLVA